HEQREPAQPQRKQELDHELAAVRIRRPQRRHDRLPREDHHVPDLLEQVLRRQERSVSYGPNHESLFASYPISSELNLDSFLSTCQDAPMQASVKPAV